MTKLNYQQLLLQSSVSHDPSEIILIYLFGTQETFIFIINVEQFSFWNINILLHCFLLSLVFIFNVSLLNKSRNFLDNNNVTSVNL